MTPGWDQMVSIIKVDHPAFVVKSYLDNWWFRFLWALGWRMGATTLITTVFMDPDLIGTFAGAKVLRHERIHIDDTVRHPVWFFLSYMLMPPFLGPSMRAYWEWRGYCEDLKGSVESLRRVDPYVIEWVVSQFTGINYLWMYPFKKYMTKRCTDFCANYLRYIETFKPA